MKNELTAAGRSAAPEQARPNKLKICLSFILCFAGPLMVLVFSAFYLNSINSEFWAQECRRNAFDQLGKLNSAADTDRFICKKIDKMFGSVRSPEDLNKACKELVKEGCAEEYLIWNKSGGIFAANFDTARDGADWRLAWRSLGDLRRDKISVLDMAETANLRRIAGPQFFPEFYKNCYRGRKLQLIRGDVSGSKKPAWIKLSDRFGLLVFVNPGYAASMPGITDFLKEHSDLEGTVSVISGEKWLGKSAADINEEWFRKFMSEISSSVKHDGKYYFKNRIGSDLYGVYTCPASKGYSLWIYLVSGIAVILLVFAAFKCCRILVFGNTAGLSLYRQMMFLFLFSDILTFSIAAAFGYEYYCSNKLYLQTQSLNEGMKHLQNIDEMYISKYSRQLRLINSSLPALEAGLRADGITEKLMFSFLNDKRPLPMHIFLSGSNTDLIGSKFGIVRDGSFVSKYRLDDDYIPAVDKLSDSIAKICRYYLACVNRENYPDTAKTQTEMIIGSLGAKDSAEMMHNFWKADGKIANWNLGEHSYPIYTTLIKNEAGLADYQLVYIWKSIWMQRSYINNIILNVNRSLSGIRIAAAGPGITAPAEALSNKEVMDFAEAVLDDRGTEIGYCRWYGEEHMMIGLKCKMLDSMCLIALVPTAEAGDKAAENMQTCLLFAFVVFLIPVLSGFFIAGRFSESIVQLQNGASAIKDRNFKYRLPDLGKDEFGRLASVFNSALIDLEEVNAAFDIQNKLADAMPEAERVPGFEYFAVRKVLSEYPSDIFAAEKPDENHIVLITGDVCGLGIGANLMTSLVRACLMHFREELAAPEVFMNKLNKLLINITGEGRKYVTLQLVLLDISNGDITIVNAGQCSPILLKRGIKQFKELKMPAYPLGVTEKFKPFVLKQRLQKDEMLAVYTGGLFENGDAGFDKMTEVFAELAAGSGNTCDFVRTALDKLQCGVSADDDMTLLAVAFNDEAGTSNKESDNG